MYIDGDFLYDQAHSLRVCQCIVLLRGALPVELSWELNRKSVLPREQGGVGWSPFKSSLIQYLYCTPHIIYEYRLAYKNMVVV